jgi:glycosyltransferase involved in cell wall biosynthesis
MPLIILECLATETPVIFSNIHVLKELLFDDLGPIGFVVDYDKLEVDIIEVAEKIKDFIELDDSELKSLKKRMAKKYESFQEAEVISDYLNIYRNLIENEIKLFNQEIESKI